MVRSDGLTSNDGGAIADELCEVLLSWEAIIAAQADDFTRAMAMADDTPSFVPEYDAPEGPGL